MARHALSLLVAHRAGVLCRVLSHFGARHLNIEALSVSPTDDPAVARVTLTVQQHVESGAFEHLAQRLGNLYDVHNMQSAGPMSDSEAISGRRPLVPALKTKPTPELFLQGLHRTIRKHTHGHERITPEARSLG